MTYIYTVKRSDRKTLEICIKDGEILVRAPRRVSDREIRRFVSDHEAWIQRHMQKQRESREEVVPLSSEELKDLADKARRAIPERVKYYADIMGVTYGRITIRSQRTKWGSCTSTGNLNFNCLLMLAPPEVLDSVVVHELCHRRHMDHSAAFYEEVLTYCPDYRLHRQWLKDHGQTLLRRLPNKK